MLKKNLNIYARFAVLAILLAGLFFITSTKTNAVAWPCCSVCDNALTACLANCENGERGCAETCSDEYFDCLADGCSMSC